jgi:hypothetical protein
MPSLPTTILPPKTFHLFPNLPTELRLQVWTQILQPSVVTVRWKSTLGTFTSTRKPPLILSVNRESREIGHRHYTLSFAFRPELARVYFAPALDTLCIDWKTLGPVPAAIAGLNMIHPDLPKVQKFAIHEPDLLAISEMDMAPLMQLRSSSDGPLSGFRSLTVICDAVSVEPGRMFGRGDLMAYLQTFERQDGSEHWPKLMCSREQEYCEKRECSSHYWFGQWNQIAATGQNIPWNRALVACLELTVVVG